MKKLLMVSDIPFAPSHEGNRKRMVDLIELYTNFGLEVWFLYLGSDKQATAAMSARLPGRVVQVPRSWTNRLKLKLSRLLKIAGWATKLKVLRRYGLDEWYDPALNPVLQKLQADVGFHFVQAEYVYMSAALDAFGDSVRKILQSHDVFSGRNAVMESKNVPNVWYSIDEEQERRGLARADVVLALSESDRRFFCDRLGANAFLADCITPPKPIAGRSFGAPLFLGSNNGSNRRGLQDFIDRVLPLIVKVMPTFSLNVVGSVCGSVADSDKLNKLGVVNDIDAVFAQTSFVVNPVDAGTGLPIKTLDGVSRGVPVVAFRGGARGFEAFVGAGIFVVEDDAAMASKIVELLQSPDLIREASASALATYQRLYEDSGRGFMAALEKQ